MKCKTLKEAKRMAKYEINRTHRKHIVILTFTSTIEYINNLWMDVHTPCYTVILDD